MAAISSSSFQPRTLGSRNGRSNKPVIAPGPPALTTAAVETLIKSFEVNPSLSNIPPQYASILAERLPVDLDVRLTVPNIHSETYFKRVIESYGSAFGSAVDIAHHGGSYKQAFCELYVAHLLETFGQYDHSSTYEAEFTRPPIDSTHARWGSVYLKAPLTRPDGVKARERHCAGAVAGEDLDSRLLSSPDSGWPYLEALKAAVKAAMPAYADSAAWGPSSGVDKAARAAAAKTLIDNGGNPPPPPPPPADPKKKEAAPAADAGAPALPPVPESLTVPYTEQAERERAKAVNLALAKDDVQDCVVDSPGAWLREWVDPDQLAAWRATGLWPATRGDSLLSTRAKELVTLLDRLAACEDHVFRLRLKALPSHLDLELVTSRLPNLSSLSLTYGAREAGVRFDRPSFGMTGKDMECLGRVLRTPGECLTSLALPCVGMDDALLSALVAALLDNGSVTHLDLGGNAITGQGLEALAKLLRGGSQGCVITSLSLQDNPLGPLGGKWLGRALRHNDTLVHLDVRMTGLRDEGAALLLAGLHSNRTAQKLLLGGNGAAGASAVALSQALCSPSCALEALDLTNNDLTGAHIALLAAGLKGSPAEPLPGGATPQANDALCSLDLRGNPGTMGPGAGESPEEEQGRAANEECQAVCRANESRRRGGLAALAPTYTAVVRE